MARTRGSRKNPVTGRPRQRVGSIALAKAKRDGVKGTRTAQKRYDKAYRARKLAKVKAQQARWWDKYGSKKKKAGTTRPTSKAIPKKKKVTEKKKEFDRSVSRDVKKTGRAVTSASGNRVKTPTTKQTRRAITRDAAPKKKVYKKMAKELGIKKKNRLSTPKEIKKATSELTAAQRKRNPIERKGIGVKAIKAKTTAAIERRHPEPKNLASINADRRKVGLEPLKTNSEIRREIFDQAKSGEIKLFAKPTKSGAGLYKTGGEGLKVGDRGRESFAGQDVLKNAKKLRSEAVLPNEQTYGDVLNARLNNRNLFARNHKKEIRIAQNERTKKAVELRATREAEASRKAITADARKLNKKIVNVGTSKAGREKAIQDLHDLQANNPHLIARKNAKTAETFAKEHGYKLKPAKIVDKTPEQILKGARLSERQHTTLTTELKRRFDAGEDLIRGGKVNVTDGKKITPGGRIVYKKGDRKYNEQYEDLRRDLDYLAGKRGKDKLGLREAYREETPVLDDGRELAALFLKGRLEGGPGVRIVKASGKKAGRDAGGIELPPESIKVRGDLIEVTKSPASLRRALTGDLKGVKRIKPTNKLNKTLEERIKEPGFKPGKVVDQNTASKYNTKDVRVIRQTAKDGTERVGFVVRRGVDPIRKLASQDNPLLQQRRTSSRAFAQDKTKSPITRGEALRGLKPNSRTTEFTKAGFNFVSRIPKGFKMQRITFSEFKRLGPGNAFLFKSRAGSKGSGVGVGATTFIKLVRV